MERSLLGLIGFIEEDPEGLRGLWKKFIELIGVIGLIEEDPERLTKILFDEVTDGFLFTGPK